MGAANSIFAAIKENEEKNVAEVKDKLQTLTKLLRNKVDAMSSKLELEAMEDQRLPIVAVVDKKYKFSVNVKDVPAKEVEKTIDGMFSGNFLDGLKSLVTTALNEFLGNVSAGEQEIEEFTVVFSNNSLLRVDYMMYKYQFESHGIKDDYQNGFCYFAQIGVLDMQKVNRQVVLYELTKSVGSQNIGNVTKQLMQIADFAKKLYAVLHILNKPSGDGQNTGMERSEGQLMLPEKEQADDEQEQDDDDDDDKESSASANKDNGM